MTIAEYSMTAFAVLNGARIAAYVPQIRCVCRDPNGAAAVSIMTWLLFTAANVATVLYGMLVVKDALVMGIFALNTAGCLAVAILTAVKRLELRSGFRPARMLHIRRLD